MSATAPSNTSGRTPWVLGAVGNLLLGYGSIYPFPIFVMFLRGTLFKHIDWLRPVFSLDDNVWIYGVLGIGGTSIALFLFGILNRSIVRHWDVPRKGYWFASTLIFLTPTLINAVWPLYDY